jgi:hypothetical protein
MKASEFSRLSKEERKKVSFKEIPVINKVMVALLAVAILAGIVSVIRGSSGKPADNNHSGRVAMMAKVMSESAVKSVLKAPESAKFTGDKTVYLESDSTATVTGTVNALNSYGVMINTTYHVKLKYVGDIHNPENWLTLESKVDE